MRPSVVCVERQPAPCPLRIVPGKSVIDAASQRWVGRNIRQETILAVNIVPPTGQKSVEGIVVGRVGVPGCWDIGRLEERGDGIDPGIKGANAIAAELNG